MSLTNAQYEQYFEDGFLIARQFFSPEAYQPVIAEINGLVDRLAERLWAAGKISDKHAEAGFETRLTLLEKQYKGAAVLIHIGGILGPELAKLWENPRLLDAVEGMIGMEIAGHPVWNLRSKTPHNPLTTVPWHQDTAYLASGCEHTLQPTAWIPLVPANSLNGTLQVVRGGHKSGRLCRHHLENSRGDRASWYLYIDESDLPEGEWVTCEMEVGDVLFINQIIPHRSTENLSDSVRWSIDLRWQRPNEPSGFEGIKDVILMRTPSDPNYRPQWDEWAKQNRIADAYLEGVPKDDAFNTMVSGPWMERWASK